MKNVYLLVTDLHFDYVKANRLNYFQEVVDAMADIIAIGDKYKQQGYVANVILMGDIFDGSLPNSSEAMQAMEIFRFFCSQFSKTYAVVGNHEITYAVDNPFWFLVSSIEDKSLGSIKRFIQPKGLEGIIAVPSVIEDGNTIFYFNHFGIEPKVPAAGNISIGLFHQNVGSNDICKMWGTFDNVEDAAYVQGYNYCFFGHLHLAVGKYYLNESHTCLAEWLGTIGRTNVNEVIDDRLSVNVPAIIVNDGVFYRVEDNEVRLKPSSECVDFQSLQAAKDGRRVIESQREVAGTSYKGTTLLETMRVNFGDTALGAVLKMLHRPWDDLMFEYKQTLLHIQDELPEESELDAEQDGCV